MTPGRLLLLVALASSGLGSECLTEPVDAFGGEGCDESVDAISSLGGRWVFSGFGSRKLCRDERFDGDFDLEGSMFVAVDRSGTGSTHGVITLDASVASDFEIDGEVRGTCVEFDTSETAGGFDLRFHFEGTVDLPDEIEGEFTSTGPPGCEGEGEFQVRID